MKQIRVNKAEFDKFRSLQIKKRNDCHASFSTNPSEENWPFATYGLTPARFREEVRKLSPKLDEVVGIYLQCREKGGRFFIDPSGVYWKDAGKRRHRFVEWRPEEPLQNESGPLTIQKLRAIRDAYKKPARRI